MTSRSGELTMDAASGFSRGFAFLRAPGWAIAGSLALHAVAYGSLGFAPREARSPERPSEVRFEVVSRAVPEPPKPLDPEPPALPEPEPQKVVPLRAPTKSPDPPAPPPAAAEPAGVTMAAEGPGDGAFTIPLGNGQALEPTAPPVAPRPSPAVAPVPSAPVRAPAAGPPLVAVSDLSSKPSPPGSLSRALRDNYPDEARRRGQSGLAKMKARIDPDGVIRRAELLNESAGGFGAACRRTLLNSRWSAPRDREGRAVATEIRYTCRFVVEP